MPKIEFLLNRKLSLFISVRILTFDHRSLDVNPKLLGMTLYYTDTIYQKKSLLSLSRKLGSY